MFFHNRNKIPDHSFTEIDEVFSRHSKSVNIMPRLGFKEALFARLKAARQAVFMPKSFGFLSLTGGVGKGIRRLVPVGVTFLIIAVIATIVFQPFFGIKTVYAQDNFVLTAESFDSLGVEPNSSFVLTSKEKIDSTFVEKNLVVNSGVDYDLEQISQNKVRLAFAEPLPVSRVVTFSLASQTALSNGETIDRPYNWAFQVKSPFRVVGTLPGNHQSRVSLNTGLEVSFNYENIDLKNFEKAFSVSPAVKGHFEAFRKTLVFVPEENLIPKTVYTITISKDLGLKGSEETLGKDYSFSFETDDSDDVRGAYFGLEDQYIITTPNDTVSLAYAAWRDDGGDEDLPIKVEVRQFVSTASASDYQQYLTALKKKLTISWLAYESADQVADLAEMPVISSFEATKVTSDWREYLLFPAPLPRGYYLATFTYSNQTSFSLIESSQVTAYAAKAVNQTLVWANSAETKKPLVGASVKFIDFDETSQTTDENGLVSLSVPDGLSAEEYSERNLLEIRSGSEALVLPLYDYVSYEDFDNNLQRTSLISSSEQSWSYLYTDRPMYQPNDVIKFWGYVENRQTGEKPKTVRVVIGESGWCSPFSCDAAGENRLVFDEAVVEVTDSGIFEGELNIEDVPAAYYSIEAKVDDEVIVTRGVTVSEYVKPAFSLSIEMDKDAVFAGESVGFTVHSEFFDGTPVNGLSLIVDTENSSQEVKLDVAGNARGQIIFPLNSDVWRYPMNTWINVRPARSEEAEIQAGASIMVFGPKVYLQQDWENNGINNKVGTVKVTARNVQAINSYDPEIFAPTVKAGQSISGELYEITYKKIETGTTYDFIKKETISQYYYEQVENKVEDLSLTSNENGEATYTFAANNSEANYKVILRARDENGLTDKFETYVWNNEGYDHDYQDKTLQFENLDLPQGENRWNFPGYKVGETVHLQTYQSGEPFVSGENGKFLYFTAQQGIRKIEISSSNAFSFVFDEKAVPNLSAFGVYFDGSAYAPIGWDYGFDLNYDNSEKELTVEVKADKDSYRPGDEVKLAVSVVDENGRPVSSTINLNVVDEAFYALAEDYANPLGELYKNVGSGVLTTKVSLSIKEFDVMAAEKGGRGGGDHVRSIFKDTADFVLLESDKNGQAEYSFILPDNITSWRVTAQGINSEKKMAGTTKINLNASLPFFVVPIMRETYLVKDQPKVLIRCAGSNVGLGDSVEYTISVPDAEVEKKEFSTVAGTVSFSLPTLSEGKHDVVITGTAAGLTDTIVRSVEIVASHLVQPTVSTANLNNQEKINGSETELTQVTFVDGGAGQYYEALVSLAGNFGDRADEIMARAVAADILKEKFAEKISEEETNVLIYQDNLAIKLLPYGSEDFDLSVKVAMAGGAPFNQNNLKTYFGNFIYNSRQIGQEISAEEAAKSYAALAALGEPVLAEAQWMLAESDELEINEKLYLALALHFSGDDEGARVIYREMIKGVTKEFGYAYLPADDVETQGEQTALMAILAAALRENDRDALEDHVTQQNQGSTLLVLDQALFIKEAIKSLKSSEVKVAYTIEGERREATLENSQTVTLALSPEELLLLNPEIKKGQAVAVSRFDTPLVNDTAPVNDQLGLVRTYSRVDATVATQSFQAGDLVKVEVKYTVPLVYDFKEEGENSLHEVTSPAVGSPENNIYEDFEITDVLPSGLAIVTSVGGFSWFDQEKCVNYPSAVKGQRVTFYVRNSERDGRNLCVPYTLVYYARVVTPGIYVAEPAYIRSVRDLNDSNHSAASAVTINE